MRFPNGLRAMNHRDYRLFFGGQLVSLIGTWMQNIGQGWLIVQLTHSALLLGLISTLQFLPTLLFALVGGALADRLPKRKTIILTQSAMALLAFVLSALVYSGHIQYWHVAALALLLGFTQTLDMPLRQAFTVEMVEGREDLGNAIALNSALFNGARLLGPAAAGLLVAKYGVALAFLLNGLSFVAVIVALFGLKAEGLPVPRKQRNILHDVKEGLRYVYRTPVVFYLIALLTGIGLFVINFQVLVTVMASDVLKAGAEGYGLLMSALGAGALIGAIIMAFRKGAHKMTITPLTIFGVALCVVTTLIFFVHVFWLACVGLFLMGATQISYTADTNTTLQVVTPDELRGRVMSVYQLAFAGTTPFGSLITGAVIERTNGSYGFLVDGGLGLLFAIGMIIWWRQAQRKAAAQTSPVAS